MIEYGGHNPGRVYVHPILFYSVVSTNYKMPSNAAFVAWDYHFHFATGRHNPFQFETKPKHFDSSYLHPLESTSIVIIHVVPGAYIGSENRNIKINDLNECNTKGLADLMY